MLLVLIRRIVFMFGLSTVVIPLRQFGVRYPLRCYSKITFEFASSSKQPLCCFAKTEIKSDFKCVFYSYIKKNVNYGLVIIIRFCH